MMDSARLMVIYTIISREGVGVIFHTFWNCNYIILCGHELYMYHTFDAQIWGHISVMYFILTVS